MTKRENRRKEMLERVHHFGATHGDAFPPESFAGRMFAAVAEAVTALKECGPAEVMGRNDERQGAESKAAARTALRRSLARVSRLARVVAFDVPGFDKAFRVRFDCSDEQLVLRARSLLKAARPLAPTFAAHDMPPAFLDRLQQDIDAFERAIASREDSRQQRVAARQGVEADIRKGLQAVRRLAAVVPHKLQDAGSLAQWDAACRIGGSRRTKKTVAA